MSESEPSGPAPTTQRIVFSGRVQGVGFRFTTRTLVRRLPLAATP